VEGEFAHRIPLISARGLGQGQPAPGKGWNSERDSLSDQGGDRARADPQGHCGRNGAGRSGYGNDTGFRQSVAEPGLQYVLGINSTTTIWPAGTQSLPPVSWKGGRGRPASRLRRDPEHVPVSAKQLAWDTSKAAAGAASTITPHSPLPPMDSWWRRGVVFFPQPMQGILDYQLPNSRRSSGPAARIRPERHNPHSIATLRILLARSLLRQLCLCPFCGAQRL